MIDWYVYNVELSHIDEYFNTNIIGTRAENIVDLAILRENKHKFLVENSCLS